MSLQAEDHTVLDDLTLIEQIENKTPWRTEDLAAWLIPLMKRYRVTDGVTVETLRAQPGVKREDQPLAEGRINTSNVGGKPCVKMRIRLLSPKRAAARTDLLDRLSLADDLKQHEAAVPPKALGVVMHMLNASNDENRGNYSNYGCVWGSCRCDIKPVDDVLIRGDTKAKTAPRKSLKRLEQELGWANRSIASLQEKLEDRIAKRDRLAKRIEKRRAKEKA